MKQNLIDKLDFMIRKQRVEQGFSKGLGIKSRINRTISDPPILSRHASDSDMTAPNSANSTNMGADLIFSLPVESFGQSCIILRDGLKNMSRKMKRSRLVRKDGYCNVYQTNVPKKERQYIRAGGRSQLFAEVGGQAIARPQTSRPPAELAIKASHLRKRNDLNDIFTTLIDAKWRWILGFHGCAFFISWIVFAVVYFVATYLHGDLDEKSLGTYRDQQQSVPSRKISANSSKGEQDTREPCIANVHTFLASFLFSVETEHTIGYGYRYVTTECPIVWVTMCLQSLTGIILQSLIVGLVFAKLARPKKRAETLIFSENAVISLRDGQLCFLFRVGDMRISHLVEAHVRVQMITKRTTMEGEVEPLYQYDMDVGFDDGTDRIFLVWPIAICHVIDETSPLYNFSSRTLPTAQFEIVVLLEGIVESTGMTAQAKTSYLPSEVFWGHRFEKLVTFQKCNGSYQIDYSLFHNTYPVNTPRCSAKELDRMKNAGVELSSSGLFFCKTQEEAELEESAAEGCSDEVTEIQPTVIPRAECTTVKNLRRCSSTPNAGREHMRRCSVTGRWSQGCNTQAATIEEDCGEVNENSGTQEQEPLLNNFPQVPSPKRTGHGRGRQRQSLVQLNPPLKPQQIVIHSPGSPPATLQERMMSVTAITSGQAIQVKNDADTNHLCTDSAQMVSDFGEED